MPENGRRRFISQNELARRLVASGPRVHVDLAQGHEFLDNVVEATALDFARIAVVLEIGARADRVSEVVVDVVGQLVREQNEGWYPIATPRVPRDGGDLEQLVRESFPICLLPKGRADFWHTIPPEQKETTAERQLAMEFVRQGFVTVRLPLVLTNAWNSLAVLVPPQPRKDKVVLRRAAFALAEIHRTRQAHWRVLCFRPKLEGEEARGDMHDKARFRELLTRATLGVQHGTIPQDHVFRPIRLDPSPSIDGISDGVVRSLVRDRDR